MVILVIFIYKIGFVSLKWDGQRYIDIHIGKRLNAMDKTQKVITSTSNPLIIFKL